MGSANGRDPRFRDRWRRIRSRTSLDGAIGGRRCVGVLLLAASLTARSSSASLDRTNEANQRRTSTRSGASRPGCAGQLRCTNSDDSPCAATGIGSPTSPPHVLTIRIRARTAPRRSDRRFHPCHPDCQPKDIAAGHARPPWSGLGCSPPAGGRAAHPFGAARPSAAPGACGEPWTRKGTAATRFPAGSCKDRINKVRSGRPPGNGAATSETGTGVWGNTANVTLQASPVTGPAWRSAGSRWDEVLAAVFRRRSLPGRLTTGPWLACVRMPKPPGGCTGLSRGVGVRGFRSC
jgi:hypothetical protein